VLLLHANEAVSTDRLVDELWGERPPPQATKTVQVYVSQLRKQLGTERLGTMGRGYVLRVEEGETDVEQVDKLCARAAEEEPAAAAVTLREALGLFRGEPLSDLAYERFAAPAVARLTELRLHVLELRIDADLESGGHANLVPELEELVARHPLQERFREQLMLALYRSGRQADALERYREGREILSAELGLEPGAGLRDVEARILRHDSSLDAPPPPFRERMARHRRLLPVLAASATLVGAAIFAAWLAFRPSPPPPTVAPNTVVRIDARRNRIAAVTPVGRDPVTVLVDGPFVWAANNADRTLSRIDRETGDVQTVGLLQQPWGLSRGPGGTVVVGSSSSDDITLVGARTLRVSGVFGIGGATTAFVAYDGRSLWVSQPPNGLPGPGVLSRLDLNSGDVVRRYPLGYPVEIAIGEGSAWVGIGADLALGRISISDGKLRRTQVGAYPSSPAVGFGSVWVASYGGDTVWRVNADTGRVETVIHVGDNPWGVAVSRDAVWVTNLFAGTVKRIDPSTNAVVATIVTGFAPSGIAAEGDDVWVVIDEEEPSF